MEKALSIKEISERLSELVFADKGGSDEGTLNGIKSIVVRGHLPSGRYANTRVSTNGELLNVGLNVPGAGGMSIHFALFTDEATDERVERYLDYYLGLHEMAVAKFAAELANA